MSKKTTPMKKSTVVEHTMSALNYLLSYHEYLWSGFRRDIAAIFSRP